MEIGTHVAATVLPNACEGQAMTSMDALKRAACLGNKEALMDPPPALVHASGLASGNFLYGTKTPPPFSDVAYKQGPPGGADFQGKFKLIGSLMMDCVGKPGDMGPSADTSVPALLFWRTAPRHQGGGVSPTLVIYVPNAPLSEMEVDMAPYVAVPTRFERFWFGDEAASKCTQRLDVMKYIHRCGMLHVPNFLLNDDYHVMRDGPLTLLRLRTPTTEYEKEQCMKLMSKCPYLELDKVDQAEDDVEDALEPMNPSFLSELSAPFDIETWFTRGDMNTERLPYCYAGARDADPEPMGNRSDFLMKTALVSSLAIAVLKQGWQNAPSERGASIPAELPDDQSIDSEEEGLEEAMNGLVQRELQQASGPVGESLEEVVSQSSRQFVSGIFSRARRSTDVAHSMSVSNTRDAVMTVAGWIFGEEDRTAVDTNTNASLSLETFEKERIRNRMRSVGRCLGPRFALLCVETDVSTSRVGEIYLDFASTHPNNVGQYQRCKISADAAVRVLHWPFVQPLLINFHEGSVDVSLVRMMGITRERTKLSPSAMTRRKADTPSASSAPVQDGVRGTDVQALTEELKTHINQQLRNFMETMLPAYLAKHVSDTHATTTHAANAPVANAPVANAPVANAPVANAVHAPLREESEAVTALKRVFPKMLSALRALEEDAEKKKRQRRDA